LRGIAAAGSGLLFAMAFRMAMAIKRKPIFLPFTVLVFVAIALLRWSLPVVMLAGIALAGALAYGLLKREEAR
jgi:chromate transporter